MSQEIATTAFSKQILVEKELKAGDRGRVLLVRDRETRERYVYREFAGSGAVYRRIQELDCPYLPRVEKVEETDGVTAVLEEYIQGDTLAFVLEGGPMPAEQAKSVAIQLCLALEALHSLDVVHRDVKPENVILRGGDAVLIDFDASRLQKAGSVTDTRVMGTTGYAAPEQYGFSQTDARADIYSLGVLLNEMLTRRHPATELARGPMGAVVEKCIEVNIDRRYASAAEVRAALETGACPIGATDRKRGWFAVLAGAAVVLAILAGWSLARRGGDDASSRLERLTVSDAPAPTEEEWSRTEFRYDLDGDGTEETYLFGVGMDLPGRRPGGVDSRGLSGDERESVTAAPCAWRMDEDGNYVMVYEFAELFDQPSVELYRVERWGTSDPEVWTVASLDGIWSGAIEAVYGADCAGHWLYVATAVLDGETFTAAASTYIERMPPPG